ncbi:hypothetical protein QVZ41_08535 [Wenyingzhuangia sp. chi5]|uniref:Uncharacterized protein n=1 Tax=Wenyingzhuangia gilva TaxID=3057677 RepID=A0ABT8VSE3_9FLAO|nr:hypothetical protein [Wenyingzhuangia sp. chi5]MDO3694889.1 hypothetical protein [Wenyingzhuangia sp. chi5]
MTNELSLHEQRKKLNNIYNTIIKRKDLPEFEFDHLMRLWILENEKLEEKEQVFEMKFLHQTNIQNYANVAI